jgi:hypothetical protein
MKGESDLMKLRLSTKSSPSALAGITLVAGLLLLLQP